MQRDAHDHEQVLAVRVFLKGRRRRTRFVWEDHRTSNRILKISLPVFVIPTVYQLREKRGLLLVEVVEVFNCIIYGFAPTAAASRDFHAITKP